MSDKIQTTTDAQQAIINTTIKALNFYGIPKHEIKSTELLKHYGLDYVEVMPLLQRLDKAMGAVPGTIADYFDKKIYHEISFDKNIFPASFYDSYINLSVLDLVYIICTLTGINTSKQELTDLQNKTLSALPPKTPSEIAVDLVSEKEK